MEAIVADLDTRRSRLHVAIQNWEHDFNIGSVVRTANAGDRNDYSDFCIPRIPLWSWRTMAEYLFPGYTEEEIGRAHV